MKKTVLDLFRFSAILLAAVPSALRADIDFSAFAHKAYITFSGYEGETTLTNFPALIRLADGGGGFAHADCALAGGRDVRFSLGDGRELPSEVVSWNEDGTSEFYVRVPELAGKSTRIMVFWGSAAAPVRDPRLKVWDRSYTGVYGMGDAGRALVDASSSDILGAVPGTVTDATGIVGAAKGFAEANKTYYTVGMPQEIPNYYLGSTMECWFKVAAFPSSDNRPMVAFYPTANMYNMGIVFRMRSSGKISANMGYSSSNGGDNYGTELTSAVAEAGVWHHAMVTFATDRTLTLYLDGARAGSTVRSKPRFPTDAILNSHTVLIGSGGDNGNWRKLYFDGILDEVRLSTIARPADYAAAVYKNLADTADFLVIEAAPATATAIEADSILRGEADGVRYVTDGDDAIYADGVVVASAPANARHVVTSHPLKKQYRVTLSSGAGGTVTPSGELWLDAGSVLDISATASDAAHAFYAWDGNCPTLEVFTASIRLPVTEPRALKAVFGTALYVKPAAEGGDDEADGLSEATAKATPWGAVHAVNAHPAYAPAVILVADGVYNTTNTVSKSASVTLDKNIALRAVLVEHEPEAVGAPPLPRGAAALVDFERQRRLDLRHAADFGEAEAPDAAVVFREKQVPVATGAFDNRNGRVAVAGNLALGREAGLDHEIRGGGEFPRDLEGRRLLVQDLVSAVGGELAAERIELLPRGAVEGDGAGVRRFALALAAGRPRPLRRAARSGGAERRKTCDRAKGPAR